MNWRMNDLHFAYLLLGYQLSAIAREPKTDSWSQQSSEDREITDLKLCALKTLASRPLI